MPEAQADAVRQAFATWKGLGIAYKLFKSRTCHARLRLYYPGLTGTTSLVMT